MRTAAVSEERKTVSVLFVDVVGSTERADGADPEDVRAVNQLYYREVSERIERFGGAIEKYVGDAVMAVFGAPVAHGDDAERAVRASLDVLQGIRELNERRPGLDLRVRAAVCTGEAMVAIDAAPGEALATGDVVNTAARLQSAAPPGGAVVGRGTYELTRHAFAYEPLDPVDAKGKREPVPAWLVTEPIVDAAERPTSVTPFVGRDREALLIRTMWDRAVTAQAPHLVSVIGPAGIGKSRLAHEISADVEAHGGRALVGRSLPYEEHTPYRAFAQMLRDAAGVYENDGADEARAKLAAFVDGLFPAEEATDATRYLSLVLGLGGGSVSEPIHLLFAARRVVELLSDAQPLLLVFEDVHWADEAMLDLVDYLVTHVHDHRVMFLVLARPEFLESRSSWSSGLIGQTTLFLEPLTTDEAATVVSWLTSDAAPATIGKVVERAEGNPLFLEELAATLSHADTDDELPGTVKAAIAGRIDALPTDARTALLHASVVGLTFWRGVVERIGDLQDVDGSFDALEARGLVRRSAHSQVTGDVEFAFKHALVRDVAYGTLPRALRRALHASVADLIEASVPDPAELAWILAHHHREGGRPERAVGYLLAAGDRARAALALEETYDFYSQALELATDDAERRRIRLRRALALTELEAFARADAELASLIPELDGAEEIEALLARATATHWTEKEELTLALAERALALARERGVIHLEPPATARIGTAYAMRGAPGDIERAIDLQERALAAWAPGVHPVALAEHYHLAANTQFWTGNYARALEFSALELAGAADPRGAEYLLRSAGMQGVVLAGMGRYEEALAKGDAAIATARSMGRPAGTVTNYSTTVLRDIFWLDEAGARSRAVADDLGPSDFNMPWMNARADVICADLLAGDVAGVEGDWADAWEEALASRAWEHWLITGRLAWVRAETELLKGRHDDAVEWASRAFELASGVRRRKYEIASLVTLGKALTAAGSADEAADALRSASERADELGTPLLRWQSRAARGRAALARAATGAEGEAHLREAAVIIREVASSLQDERAARYVAAPEVAHVLEAVG
jgi:class 3 adenylate cyclase/tetratricopeptide (TPR) repeat protein